MTERKLSISDGCECSINYINRTDKTYLSGEELEEVLYKLIGVSKTFRTRDYFGDVSDVNYIITSVERNYNVMNEHVGYVITITSDLEVGYDSFPTMFRLVHGLGLMCPIGAQILN